MSDTQPAQTRAVRQHLHGALTIGTRLRAYEIEAVLGHGGFGITYRARDSSLGREVAIKEYMPAQLAFRQDDATVVPRSIELAPDFNWGLERFLDEARTLAKLDRVPGIVRVHDYLQANGTAYMVMELVKGDTLQQRLKLRGPLSPEAIGTLLPPLLHGLEALHAQGFLHRDIKPANLLIGEAGHPTLIDFGASRVAMAGRSTTLTAVFSPGYAAVEQMSADRQQGPWTDIYSLSATLYHAITGKQPPSALDRVASDSLEPLSRLKPPGFPATLLGAIDAGLSIRASRRPQSIAQWRGMLDLEAWSAYAPGAVRRRGGLKLWLGAGVAAAVLATAAGSYFFLAARNSGEAVRARLSDLLARSAPAFPLAAREAQVAGYLAAGSHKALAAFHPSGSWRTTNVATAALAEEHALEACQVRYGEPCTLLAVDEAIQPPEVAAARRPMERVAYAGSFDPQKIPAIGDDARARRDVAQYRGTPGAKAAALHPSGHLVVSAGAGDQRAAEEQALSACNAEAQRSSQDGPCFLYATAEEVVLARRSREPVSPRASAPVVTQRAPLGSRLSDMVAAVSPHVTADSRQARIASYLAATSHKALAAFPPSETWRSQGWASASVAEEGTLEGCQVRYGDPCVLLAVDDVVQPAEVALRRRTMPRASYAGVFDAAMIPVVTAAVRARADVAGYRAARGGKAAALHPWGRLFIAEGIASQRQAEERALADCNADPDRQNRDGPCFLYAVGNQVVLPRRALAPLSPAEPPNPEMALRAVLLEQSMRVAPSWPASSREAQVAGYLAANPNKALAGHPSGSWRASHEQTPRSAEQGALEGCEIVAKAACVLLAVNHDVERLGETPARRAMPRVAYQGTFDPSQIPVVGEMSRGRSDITGYRNATGPKAVALHPWGRVFVAIGQPSQRQAEEKALDECNASRQVKYDDQDAPCYLYAAGDQVVLSRRATAALAAPPVRAEPQKTEPDLRGRLVSALSQAAPYTSKGQIEMRVSQYLDFAGNKAFAAYPTGFYRIWEWESPSAAEESVLEQCQVFTGQPCLLIAVNAQLQPESDLSKPRAMPRVGYDGAFDPGKIPAVVQAVRGRADVVGYRAAVGAKAAAFNPQGPRLFVTSGAASERQAEEKVLSECNADSQRRKLDGPCFLYAAGDSVVLPRRSIVPLAGAGSGPGTETSQSALRSALLERWAKVAPSAPHRELQVVHYLSDKQHKALSSSPFGSMRNSGWSTAMAAEERSLEACQVRYGEPCQLIAVDDTVQSAEAAARRRAMPRVLHDGLFDPQRVPAVAAAVRSRADVAGYRGASGPKAAALHGAWGSLFIVTGAATQREAEAKALADCNSDPQRNHRDGACLLYAAGNQVVLPRRAAAPLTAQ